MENIMSFYVVMYMILGLVIYHSIFEIWYFNFGKAIVGELFGALFFAMVMSYLTMKYWIIAFIIIVLLGFMMSAKVNNQVGKKLVIGVFVVVAIITAISGIKYNKQEKEQEDDQYAQVTVEEKIYHPTIDSELPTKFVFSQEKGAEEL